MIERNQKRRLVVQRSLATATAAACLIASATTIRDVVEDPGGIFRTDAGLHWPHILETAWSWFYPVFILAAILSMLVFGGLAARQRRRSMQP